MLSLSDEIGKLTNLKELNLSLCTEMVSLPSSFGDLTNLIELDPSESKKLQSLSDEFGRLANLKELDLTDTEMTSLPSSIGKLINLNVLHIPFPLKSNYFPDEFGRLDSLEVVIQKRNSSSRDSSHFATTKVPIIFEKLKNLRALRLPYEYDPRNSYQALLNIAQRCPFFGCLSFRRLTCEKLVECEKLEDSLLRNRVRALLLDPSSKIPPSLWSLIFHNANRESSLRYRDFDDHGFNCGQLVLPQSDAIFHILVELRGINHIISEWV